MLPSATEFFAVGIALGAGIALGEGIVLAVLAVLKNTFTKENKRK